ncbi:MAG: hypothetical protein VB115_02345 [Christensenellaceae bacterium]|nr:hypothetical protein [Christensenellaceae bacterium]
MKDLVRAQLCETALWKWLVLLCLLFGAINISLTSHLSTEFSNAPVYEDLLLRATNNGILVSYTYMFLLPVLIGYAGIPSSWQAQLCIRSGSRWSWLFSVVLSLMIKVALYIAMICLSVWIIGMLNGAVLARSWTQIRSAPRLFDLSPLGTAGIALGLVYARLLFFSLLALPVNVALPKYRCGAFVSLAASCCIDANFMALFPHVPFELSPNYHSIFAFPAGSFHWHPRAEFGWSLLYWVIIGAVIILITYRFAARTDFGDQRVR